MNDFGKIPPQNLELETAVLGAIILESEAINVALPILRGNVFYYNQNALIYESILELNANRQVVDLLTVTNKLRVNGKLEDVGGTFYVSRLMDNIGSSRHLENHCRILQELFLKRETIRVLTETVNESYQESDIFEIYNKINRELSILFELSINADYFNIKDVISERLEQISLLNPDEKGMIGIDTGFSKLNQFTNGFQPADYVIIGARPSMGKTIIALLIAKACNRQNKKALIFSMEMSRHRIADRLISIDSQIDSRLISSNRLNDSDWEKIDSSLGLYKNNNIYIIDNSGLTIEDLKAKAITICKKHGISEIIIDYIQLMRHSFPKRNTNDNVTHISKNLKSLAKDTESTVIALSQLNRSGSGYPEMKDLRDSGSLEQDADIVWFLHREDYEGRQCDEDAIRRIDNIIAKNRNGQIGAFFTYRNDSWSYIGELPFEELNSLTDNMPFSITEGIEPMF